MTRLVLSLLSSDLKRTRSFYALLGFCASGGSDDGEWMELARDDAVMQFFIDPPESVASQPVVSGTIYLHVDSIDHIAASLAERVPFEWGPEVMPYGRKELAVRDPDGYLVAFSAPA